MAELSTLSPSPPALGDPHAAPSIPPSSPGLPPPNSTATESPREVSIPKSSLFNDKALSGKTSAVLAGGSPLIPHPSSNPPDLTAEAPLLSSVQQPAPGNEESAGKPPAPSEVAQASPSPDLNPGPNLHITCNPNPVVEEAPQTQTTAGPNPAPAPPVLSSSATAAEGEKPQPLQEAQNALNEPPPLYPKPGTPNEARMGELPATPTRAEPHSPPLPLIQEPPLSFALPKPRPAPDTLSYLESASLMSGTLESLSGLGEDGSSVGSDSEINGLTVRRTDKYGFLGGNQYSEGGEKEVRVEVARQREMKWIDMFCHWDKWVKHRFQKVKLRCRKGIPSSLRARAWQLLSNSEELLRDNPGKFEELEREQGEAKWLDIIEKDLHRQFPFHEMFAARGGHG